MVQLSSPALDVSPPPERSEDGKKSQGSPKSGSSKMGSPGGLRALQLALAASTTTYQGYENYIEDGLICLKHKIRNLEKKKLKLEDYTKRMNQGETLNKDQLDAVQKYDEVLHNLAFARDLHKTLDSLTQDLLRAQKKATKREEVVKGEAERRRLSTVLQVQHVLHSLQQEHVRKELLSGDNQAPHLPAHTLHSLLQLATLLGIERNKGLSLEEQMEKSSQVYVDLLEGKDKPVAGSTFKLMKEELDKLLDCDYFNHLPPPPSKTPKEAEREPLLQTTLPLSALTKSNTNDVSKKEFLNRLYLTDAGAPPAQNWKLELQAMKEREPPDSWDTEHSDRPGSPKPVVHKPWRGAATLIPKVPGTIKKQSADGKQRKKAKGYHNAKAPLCSDAPVEVFDSPSSLPEDPVLRKQHLEDLMRKIHGSFSFMQDSLLDGDSSPNIGHPRLGRRPSESPSPLAQIELSDEPAQQEFSDEPRDLRSPVDSLATTMHSTPLPTRLMTGDGSLTNGEPALENCDLELTTEDLPHEPLELSDSKAFPSPPLFCRDSGISVSLEETSHPLSPVTESGTQSPCNGGGPRTPTPPQAQDFSTPPQAQDFSTPPSRRSLTMVPPAPFQSIHSVFKVSNPLPQNGDLEYKPDTNAFSEIRYSTASTQTPPEFVTPEDELQPVYQSEYMVGNGGQIFLSPGQSGGGMGRSGQSYYRGSVRGMARGGKGLAHSFRSSGWHRGGTFIPHLRDYGPILYGARDHGYQHSNRRGGARHNSSGWSDSSQVSSPDREATFTVLDSSGHGDSLSVSTMEMPVAPHATLLPMQLYPLSQPLRVAFTASRTANFAPGSLDQPIVFDQMHSNLGDMYDAHVGRFTCPSSGTYVFLFHILKLAVNVPLYINLMRNDEVMVSAYANDGAPDHETASNHAILPLYQGDQVWLRLHRGAIYGSTWKYSTFSGFLLYQD